MAIFRVKNDNDILSVAFNTMLLKNSDIYRCSQNLLPVLTIMNLLLVVAPN